MSWGHVTTLTGPGSRPPDKPPGKDKKADKKGLEEYNKKAKGKK